MRIAIVDDDVAFRRDLASLLNATLSVAVDDFDSDSFLFTHNSARYDLLFIDPFARESTDTTALFRHARAEAARVVVLSYHSGVDCVSAALNHQVDGYLLKTDSDLAQSVAELLTSHQPIVSRGVSSVVFSLATAPRIPGPSSLLTTREIEVLQLVVQERSNREIADQLGIAENTVKNHVRHVLTKMHCRSRVGAVVAAIRDGLIDLDTAN
ncbi:MAG: response regulator transcription factor [Nitriliruptoraceae bacterium]